MAAFRAVVAPPERPLDLLDGAVAVAAPEYPLLRPQAVGGQLDAWARTVRAHVSTQVPVPRPPDLLAGVCQVLFREAGLAGDREDYDDPRNSFVNEVINRRRGLPITLCVVFLEVARRVGLVAHGVGFPGHFLARVEDPEQPGTFVVVDAFGGGTILGVTELQALLEASAGPQARLDAHMLAPVPPRGILARMLRNLRGSYAAREDYPRALLAQERLLVLEPEQPGEVRDLGLLLAQADEPGAAIATLERYLALAPAAPDAAQVAQTLRVLRAHGFSVQ